MEDSTSWAYFLSITFIGEKLLKTLSFSLSAAKNGRNYFELYSQKNPIQLFNPEKSKFTGTNSFYAIVKLLNQLKALSLSHNEYT